MAEFVHLHTHTEFSLLDGLSSAQALADYAAELGMPALAITDHGTMFGVVDFYKACKKAEIKPIIGFEAYLARASRTSRDKNDGKPYHIILLAQNQTGYQNLLQLASIAQLEGFYYKPRIDKEVLARYSDGLIVLSACVQGEVRSCYTLDRTARRVRRCAGTRSTSPAAFTSNCRATTSPNSTKPTAS